MISLSPIEFKSQLRRMLFTPMPTLNIGGMSHIDGDVLTQLALNWGGPVFEIGVEYGNSSAYILAGLRDGTRLYSCDIQDVRDLRLPNQVFYLAKSVHVHPGEQCTWAFIDGDHTKAGVIADIEHCLDLGIERMVFHDARPGDPTDGNNHQKGTDVLAAVQETLPEGVWEHTLVKTPCGLLVVEPCPISRYA